MFAMTTAEGSDR